MVEILDICCGTGDITHQLENFTPKNYEIIGMDFSSEIVKIKTSLLAYFCKL